MIAATEEAIARVERSANPEWLAFMYDLLYGIAQVEHTFTTQLVWDICETEFTSADIPYQHEPSALGPVVRYLVEDGVIKNTGEYILSDRPIMHSKPMRVWESLCCPKEIADASN